MKHKIRIVFIILSTFAALVAAASGTTLQNLNNIYQGESNAAKRYRAFVLKAESENLKQTAKLFRAASASEEIHRKIVERAILKMGWQIDTFKLDEIAPASTADNLRSAIKGEAAESATMYPDFQLHMLFGLVAAFALVVRIILGIAGSRYNRFTAMPLRPVEIVSYNLPGNALRDARSKVEVQASSDDGIPVLKISNECDPRTMATAGLGLGLRLVRGIRTRTGMTFLTDRHPAGFSVILRVSNLPAS